MSIAEVWRDVVAPLSSVVMFYLLIRAERQRAFLQWELDRMKRGAND